MKNLVLFLACFLTSMLVYPQITFEKTYGGAASEQAFSCIQVTDSGYLMTGHTSSGSGDVLLIRTNAYGDTLWTKTYGGIEYESGQSALQTNDGGFIIAGYKLDANESSDFYLIKTDGNGDSLWTKALGGLDDDMGFSVIQHSDGGFIIAGDKYIPDIAETAVYLMKTNANGDSVWSKTYIGGDAWGSSVIRTYDNGYLIAGGMEITYGGRFDAYLIKTNSNGDSLWSKTYGDFEIDYGSSVIQAFDSSYVMVGTSNSYGAGSYDIYLVKTNENGDTLWTKTFGGQENEYGYSIAQTNDSCYIITGFTYSYGAPYGAVYLLKINTNGDIVWTRTFGGQGEIGRCVAQTNDGGFIITGEAPVAGLLRQFFLIKTDEFGNAIGNLGMNDDEQKDKKEIVVYPNPTSGKLSIQVPADFGIIKTSAIYNGIGQLKGTFGMSADIDLGSYEKGLYFMSITNDKGEKLTTRIIIK